MHNAQGEPGLQLRTVDVNVVQQSYALKGKPSDV